MTRNISNIKYEDIVQCFYFTTKELTNAKLRELCDTVNETIASLCQKYIWHRDEFKVVLPLEDTGDKEDIPQHLQSITCFGDNIEDEWFIVYVLIELTKIYSELIIQVEDNDGDFLLIEAADYLPAWCSPDNTENRVFIYQENIHIIPPTIAPFNSNLNISDALQIIKHKSKETIASLNIQNQIYKRLCNYTQNKNDNSFKAIVNLPVEVAVVLTLKPSLISPLVTAFCTANSHEVKDYKSIQFDDCVNAEVKFTKYLYAMLRHTKIVNVNRFKHLENDKKSQLGLKLTCGYNNIMKLSKDAYNSLEYQKFLNSLINNGYFKGNLEGSKEYNLLLEKAKDNFDQIYCPNNIYIFDQINNLKSFQEFNEVKEFIKQRSDLDTLEEDNDEWLNIQPNQLEDLLNSQYGKKKKLKHDDLNQDISSKLNKFLKETSDFEGIERMRNDRQDDNDIEFDSEQFVNCVEKMLNIISNEDIPESDTDDLSGDEYLEDNTVQDLELASKLKRIDETSTSSNVLQNLIQSLKEERLSGPSSTVFRSIGVQKSELLDSDDDDDDS